MRERIDNVVVDPDYYESGYATVMATCTKRPPRYYTTIHDRYEIVASGGVWDAKRSRWCTPLLRERRVEGGDCWVDDSFVFALWTQDGGRKLMSRGEVKRKYENRRDNGRITRRGKKC